MRYIGIDVSKATFMVAYPQQNGGYKTREFKNTAKGVHEFIHTLDTDDHCVMEATGNHQKFPLLFALNFVVIQPKPSKNNHQMHARLFF